jgi:Uma2 family endonuclease
MNNNDGKLHVSEAAEPAYQETKRFTYADYAKWETDERFELIDGYPVKMSAPAATHQRILRKLSTRIDNFLNGKTCELFVAPFDVCLFGLGEKDKTVVQPDLLVICDDSKIDEKYCNGAPDLVIEILSPSNRSHDILVKFNLYLGAGVKEYWVVDPEDKTLSVHIMSDGQYNTSVYDSSVAVPVHVLDGCVINMSEVFNS